MSKSHPLSLYLLKPGVNSPADAISESDKCTKLDVPPEAPDGSCLFVRCASAHPPAWISFFPQQAQDNLQKLTTASAGAAFIFPAYQHWFALCFGTGRYLLKPDCYVRDFGLRASLSLVRLNTLKAVDVATYDNLAKYHYVSTSKGTTIDAFDIQEQLDLLRGVFGECGFAAIATQIGGKDSCHLWTRVEFPRLPKLCRTLFAAYSSRRVAERYPAVDNVARVRDRSEIARLDSLLDATLARGEPHEVTVAPPEVVTWERVHEFRLEFGNEVAAEPSLSFQAIHGLLSGDVTCERCRQARVETITPDGAPGGQRWKLYACLVAEMDDPDNTEMKYILMAGDWYTVAASFCAQTDQGIANIPAHSARVLPRAQPTEKESEYNARFAATDTNNLVLLDRRLIPYGGGGRIEVCDIVSSDGHLYHIKDYHGSATLSHLFSQGTVASRLLLEEDFRKVIAERYPGLPADVFAPGAFQPGNLEVVYGFICESARAIPGGLPFFSKVRLLAAEKELKSMGFRVSTAKIEREDDSTTPVERNGDHRGLKT